MGTHDEHELDVGVGYRTTLDVHESGKLELYQTWYCMPGDQRISLPPLAAARLLRLLEQQVSAVHRLAAIADELRVIRGVNRASNPRGEGGSA